MANHGTRSQYANDGCRCNRCRKANSAYSRNYRKKGKVPDGVAHGLRTTYTNHGCRCEPCKRANSIYKRSRYSAKQHEGQ